MHTFVHVSRKRLFQLRVSFFAKKPTDSAKFEMRNSKRSLGARVAKNPGFLKAQPSGLYLISAVKPRFCKNLKLVGSGISMGFQLLE